MAGEPCQDEVAHGLVPLHQANDEALKRHLRFMLEKANLVAVELSRRGVFVFFRKEGDDVMEVDITKELGL